MLDLMIIILLIYDLVVAVRRTGFIVSVKRLTFDIALSCSLTCEYLHELNPIMVQTNQTTNHKTDKPVKVS